MRRSLCPASLQAEGELGIDIQSDAATQGEAAHEATRTGITDELDSELEDAVEHARGFMEEMNPGGFSDKPEHPWIWEQRLSADFDGEQIWGYPDAYFIWPELQRVYLIELKFGRIPPMEQNVGLQVGGYAYLILATYADVTEVWCTVLYARLNKVYRMKVTRADMPFLAARITDIRRRCMEDVVQFNPGPEQCEYCTALSACKAAEMVVTKAINVQVHTPFSIERFTELLELLPLMTAWMAAMRQRARLLLEQNVAIPGWHLKPRRGTRYVPPYETWEALKRLRDWFDLDEMFNNGLLRLNISATQEDFYRRAKRLRGLSRSKSLNLFEEILGDTLQRGKNTLQLKQEKRDSGEIIYDDDPGSDQED